MRSLELFVKNHSSFLFWVIRMNKKYNIELLGFINIFEKNTKTKVKDCFLQDESLVFLVDSLEVGKSIGKNGNNIKNISRLLKKKIRVIGFYNDAVVFIKNILNIKAEVRKEDNLVIIKCDNTQDRAQIIGRDMKNLRNLKDTVKRYFDVEIKVI